MANASGASFVDLIPDKPPEAMLELCKNQFFAEGRGRSMKSGMEQIEIVNACELVRTYRAAALCGG
jgi:hypothetical protein